MDPKTLLYATLAPRFYNQPLLINPSYLPLLAERIKMQPPADMTAQLAAVQAALQTGPQLQVSDGIAVIPIFDVLCSRTDAWTLYFGLTSYEDIRAQFQAALADPAVKNIVFDIASPGGEAAGCFDLVDEIYQARGQKPMYAIFNGYGYSAAFAIASAADKRYISRTGSAGSVGVVAMHMDQSGWDAQMGLAFTYIYAGAHKVDYSSHAPLAPEAKAAAQEDINAQYDLFVNTMARNLGLTAAAVRASEAQIYQGKKAVDVGFADSVMSWSQAMGKLQNRKYGGVMKAELEKIWAEMCGRFLALVGADPAAANQETVTKADVATLVAAAEGLAKQEGHAAGLAAGLEQGKLEATARATAIMEACALVGMEKEALGYVKDMTLSAEQVGAKIIEAQAAAAEATRIRSTVGAVSTGEVSPLLADARKRAGKE